MDVIDAEPGTTEAIEREQPDKMSVDAHDCGSPMDAVHTAPGPTDATQNGSEDAAQIGDTDATEVATGQVDTGEAKHPTHRVSKRNRRSASRNSDNDADIDELASDQDERVAHVKNSDEDDHAEDVKDSDEVDSIISIEDSDEADSIISVKDSDEDDDVKDPDYKMSDDDDDDDDDGGLQSQRGMGRSASGTRSRASGTRSRASGTRSRASGTRSRASTNSSKPRSWQSEPDFPKEHIVGVNASIRKNLHLLDANETWEKQLKDNKDKYLGQMTTEWSFLKTFPDTLSRITSERLSQDKSRSNRSRKGPPTSGRVVKRKANKKRQVSKKASVASVLGDKNVATALKNAGCGTISELLALVDWEDNEKREFFKKDASLDAFWVRNMMHILNKIMEETEETEETAEDTEETKETKETGDVEEVEDVEEAKKAEVAQA
ncbi:hypothetical protein EIP86_008748 [Pleurotus ostreatoroseus]|nr:hypothetical protein EIP86_008748 [Pleurotus ostreatoroseus]